MLLEQAGIISIQRQRGNGIINRGQLGLQVWKLSWSYLVRRIGIGWFRTCRCWIRMPSWAMLGIKYLLFRLESPSSSVRSTISDGFYTQHLEFPILWLDAWHDRACRDDQWQFPTRLVSFQDEREARTTPLLFLWLARVLALFSGIVNRWQ